MSYGRADVALDHAKLRERGELLQMWPPDVVLERGFRDDRYLARQQQPKHVADDDERRSYRRTPILIEPT
jgi:hypothetical protein